MSLLQQLYPALKQKPAAIVTRPQYIRKIIPFCEDIFIHISSIWTFVFSLNFSRSLAFKCQNCTFEISGNFTEYW